MLPCNLIVQETAGNKVEVAAIDPVASMQAIDHPHLADIALETRTKIKGIVNGL